MAAGDSALPYPIHGGAYRIYFPILDNDGDLVADAAGLDTELSKDGGTFADAINEATQIAASSGMYYLDIDYTETQCSCLAGKVHSTTADSKDTPFVLYPRQLPVLISGTAAAGANGSITLAAASSAIDDFYNGCIVLLQTNTGAGQARIVTDYNGTTKVATVSPNWGTNPDDTSTYAVLLTDLAVNRILHADAIGAAQMGTDAIGALELGTDAVTEITDAVAVVANARRAKIQSAQKSVYP